MKPDMGEFLVKTARKAIEEWVRRDKIVEPGRHPKDFDEKRGVFTSLHTYPEKELRGCIGYPEPVFSLIDALVRSAISATEDPRFPKLSEDELDKIVVEVSVLSVPEEISVKSPGEYLKKVDVGRDGLIIRKGPFSGLLLPQVPVELGWDAKTFLDNLCLKAGLSLGEWKEAGVSICRFRSEIFSEESPNGRIIRQ